MNEAMSRYLAAANAGDADAMYQIARLLTESGDAAGGEHWARQAAQAGSTKGMRVLGHIHEQRGEDPEADYWYAQASEAGDTWSMSARARRFRGTDDTQAVHWYRMAANAHDSNAAFELAIMLAERGELKEAEYWARAAASGQDARALFHLADILEKGGKGAEAEQYYRHSAELGFFLAAGAMARIAAARGDQPEALRWMGRMAETQEAWVNRIAGT